MPDPRATTGSPWRAATAAPSRSRTRSCACPRSRSSVAATGDFELLRPDPVVLRVVRQLGEPEGLEEGWEVHPEPAAVALPEAVPPSDRIRSIAAPRLDRSGLRILLLVGGAEIHPVAVLLEHPVQVVDGTEVVLELGRADLADERRRVCRLVPIHRVLRRPGRRLEDPRLRFRPAAGCHV